MERQNLSIQMDDVSIWHYFEISATSQARCLFARTLRKNRPPQVSFLENTRVILHFLLSWA